LVPGNGKVQNFHMAPDDKDSRYSRTEPRGSALHLAGVPLGQVRTSTFIDPPHSSLADPRGKKAMRPFGSSLLGKNAALSLELWIPES
jgi:hypothetical protein